jgi:hypothetical protein
MVIFSGNSIGFGISRDIEFSEKILQPDLNQCLPRDRIGLNRENDRHRMEMVAGWKTECVIRFPPLDISVHAAEICPNGRNTKTETDAERSA